MPRLKLQKLHVIHVREPKPGITWPPDLADDSREGVDWVQNEQTHEVENAFVKDGCLHLVGDQHGDEDNDFLISLDVVESAKLGRKELIHRG